jgi:hypothetical protein
VFWVYALTTSKSFIHIQSEGKVKTRDRNSEQLVFDKKKWIESWKFFLKTHVAGSLL